MNRMAILLVVLVAVLLAAFDDAQAGRFLRRRQRRSQSEITKKEKEQGNKSELENRNPNELFNENGIYIGFIDKDGVLFDAKGVPIGFQAKDGKLYPYVGTSVIILEMSDEKRAKIKAQVEAVKNKPSTAQTQLWLKQLRDKDVKVRDEALRNLIKAHQAITKAIKENKDAEVEK